MTSPPAVICLRDTVMGQVIEIGADGVVSHSGGSWVVEKNDMAKRLAEAAAGGMDPLNLPARLDALYSDDVTVDSYGEDEGGPWLKLRLIDAAALVKFAGFKEREQELRNRDLTLRAAIFAADMVHYEAEPTPENVTDKEAIEAVIEFLYRPEVAAELGVPPATPDTCPALCEFCARHGFDFPEQIPLAIIEAWAVDHGLEWLLFKHRGRANETTA